MTRFEDGLGRVSKGSKRGGVGGVDGRLLPWLLEYLGALPSKLFPHFIVWLVVVG